MQQFLLHRYLHNLQLGIDCLGHGTSAVMSEPSAKKYCSIIKLPYVSANIYARSIEDNALDSDVRHDFPILLSDRGATLSNFSRNERFHTDYMEAWLIEVVNNFNVILDLQTPHEVHQKYNLNIANNDSLVSLTHYHNLYQQICSFIAFVVTAHDTYNLYFKQGEHNHYQIQH